jgi:hypothetical protein
VVVAINMTKKESSNFNKHLNNKMK